MKTIWKFPLTYGKADTFNIPHPATPVLVGAQQGRVCVWIEVEDDRDPVQRTFVVHGTGHEIGENERHVGSVQMEPFVWHIYEVIR